MDYPRWKGADYKKAERVEDLGPYVCKKHGPDENPVVFRRKNGYIHRRCRECYKAIQRPLNRVANRNIRRQTREFVLHEYGGRCACCGESNFGFLTIDHLRYDEPSHKGRRRSYGGAGTIYSWLKSHGMPKDGYVIGCYNCNLGRERNGGICPHKP